MAIIFLSNILFSQNNTLDSKNEILTLSSGQEIILVKDISRVKVAEPEGIFHFAQIGRVYSLADAKEKAKKMNARDFSYNNESHTMKIWGKRYEFGQTCNCKKNNSIIIYKIIADSDSIIMIYGKNSLDVFRSTECPDGTIFVLSRKKVESLKKQTPKSTNNDEKEKMRKLLLE